MKLTWKESIKPMSVETLNLIKNQAKSLSSQEKVQLADFLMQEAEIDNKGDLGLAGDVQNEERIRNWRIQWLKDNREKYAGQYVALADYKLVGAGKTIQEANEEAKKKGVKNAFLVRVSSENEILSGGW